MTQKTRVLLVDDHPLVRAGIRTILGTAPDIEIVAESEDGGDAVERCEEHFPDILLLDLSMPGLSALEVIEQLKERSPRTKVIVLTAYDDDALVRGTVDGGAAGYVMKDEAIEVVLAAIRAVMAGGTWFSRQVLQSLLHPPQNNRLPNFTTRESDVLALIGQGQDNSQIAKSLHLAEQTVRNYASRIYEKIGVRSRPEAVVWAIEHDFTSQKLEEPG